jgi:hypothetical protein
LLRSNKAETIADNINTKLQVITNKMLTDKFDDSIIADIAIYKLVYIDESGIEIDITENVQ